MDHSLDTRFQCRCCILQPMAPRFEYSVACTCYSCSVSVLCSPAEWAESIKIEDLQSLCIYMQVIVCLSLSVSVFVSVYGTKNDCRRVSSCLCVFLSLICTWIRVIKSKIAKSVYQYASDCLSVSVCLCLCLCLCSQNVRVLVMVPRMFGFLG